MGLGHEETEQSLDDEVNRRLREIPTKHLQRAAARVQILAMQRKAPKAFLCQGTKPRSKALPAPGTASRAETRAERSEPGAAERTRRDPSTEPCGTRHWLTGTTRRAAAAPGAGRSRSAGKHQLHFQARGAAGEPHAGNRRALTGAPAPRGH